MVLTTHRIWDSPAFGHLQSGGRARPAVHIVSRSLRSALIELGLKPDQSTLMPPHW